MRRLLRIMIILVVIGIVPVASMIMFPKWAEAMSNKSWGQTLWMCLIAGGVFTIFTGLDLLNRTNIYRKFLQKKGEERDNFWKEDYAPVRLDFVKSALLSTLVLSIVLVVLVLYLVILPKAPESNWHLWTIKLAGIGVIIGVFFILNAVWYIGRGSLVILGQETKAAKVAKQGPAWHDKLFQIRSSSTDSLYDLKEDFDGISELNNPAPPWFMFLFYSTVIFGVIYFIRFSVLGYGPTQDREYKNDLAKLETQWKANAMLAENNVDENTVTLLKDPAKLAEAKQEFVAKCAACHGENAQGINGPNLTDAYWKHGNSVKEIFKTIKYGVLDKGMAAWGEAGISPPRIRALASYIISIQGSNPKDAKAPEGEKKELIDKFD